MEILSMCVFAFIYACSNCAFSLHKAPMAVFWESSFYTIFQLYLLACRESKTGCHGAVTVTVKPLKP